METSLDQKRRELFELHKAKIGTDAPLMRKAVTVAVAVPAEKKKVAEQKPAVTTRNKIKYAIIGVTGILVLIELIFLAREAGWLK